MSIDCSTGRRARIAPRGLQPGNTTDAAALPAGCPALETDGRWALGSPGLLESWEPAAHAPRRCRTRRHVPAGRWGEVGGDELPTEAALKRVEQWGCCPWQGSAAPRSRAQEKMVPPPPLAPRHLDAPDEGQGVPPLLLAGAEHGRRLHAVHPRILLLGHARQLLRFLHSGRGIDCGCTSNATQRAVVQHAAQSTGIVPSLIVQTRNSKGLRVEKLAPGRQQGCLDAPLAGGRCGRAPAALVPAC